MVDVFVSYSSLDRERVRPFVARLEQEGWSIWWDRRIESGSTWDTEIEQALESARCVVVLWTPSSVVSDWVRNEATDARDHGKLVPVLLDDVRTPLAFRRTQARRLAGWPGTHDPFELSQTLADIRLLVQGGRRTRRPTPLDSERSERRQVTVLHFGLSGITDLADEREPEAIDDWSRGLEEQLRTTVQAMGGTLIHFDGAGGSCAFGVQITSEDDEVCAAETAFALIQALQFEPRVRLRMGLASGRVVVGPGATPGVYRLSGAVAANARALALKAQDGQVLVNDVTQRRLAPYFDTEASGTGYALRGRNSVRNRLDAARVLGLSTLVGRKLELATLEAVLDDAMSGTGRAVCLVGEAGLGKSRLLHEFHSFALEKNALVVEAHCMAHGQTSAYMPFCELLRDLLRVRDLPLPEQAAQIQRRLTDVSPAMLQYLPQVLHMLAVPSAAHRMPDTLEGVALRHSLGQALVALLSLVAQKQTVLLALEDWHWADEASKELLPLLLDMCASHRVLLIVCARPESAPVWPTLPHCSQLVLRALNRAQVGELAGTLARADKVDDELTQLMHARTDGVPLFVEELSRALLEEGHIGLEAAVLVPRTDLTLVDLPGTVEAVVRARLDRLDEEAQELLRVASVIGREFERRTLDELFDDAPAVTDMLAELVAQGLVQQSRVVPEPSYRFRHLLTKEVAYESLLLKQRRVLHERVGEHIERRHANAPNQRAHEGAETHEGGETHEGQKGEQLELLAHHFERSAATAKAIHYLLLAGERAVNNAALGAAVQRLNTAVELLEAQVPSTQRDEQLLQACVALGNARILVQGYAAPEVVKTYGRARELSHLAAPSQARFASLWMLWRYYYNRAMLSEAGEFAAQMLAQAEVSADSGQVLAAHVAHGVVHNFAGRHDRARSVLEQAVAMSRPQDERVLAFRYAMSPTVQALSFLGLALAATGQAQAGVQSCQRAVALARDINHPPSEVLALQYQIAIWTFLEELEASSLANKAAMDLATKHEMRHWQSLGRMHQGAEMLARGDVQNGLAIYQAAAAVVNAMGVAMTRVQQNILLGTVCFHTQRFDEGLALMAQSRELMDFGGLRWLEPEVERLSAKLMQSSDPAAARVCFERGVAVSHAHGNLLGALRVASDWAVVLARAGKHSEALALLQKQWQQFDLSERSADLGLFRRIRNQLSTLVEKTSP